LRALEARYGLTQVRLRSAAPEQVVQDVLNGVVQLGASSLPLEHKGLQVLWLGQAPCVAVMVAGDLLAALPVVPLAALAQRRIVTMSNPYRLRHRLNAVWPQGAGAADAALQQPFIETNSSINAQALVRAGLGVAVLEPLTALGAPAEGVVVRPLDLPIPFDFGVVVPAGRPISAPVQALADALLAAAQAVPGFVQHSAAEQARLLQGKPAAPELTDNF
jgi:DNA-binding transcriptional LysR family regulator